ncbi:DUF2300 domain-containing protein [Aquirhabdus sp.]|uniref:DUF2300 domain-containing protein n=1 Tax=Aquirhabdus sp. TaxID=2824160 RepID=UPI00396CD64D
MRWQRWHGVVFGMVGVMLQSHVYADTASNVANQGWIVSQQTLNHPVWLLGDAKQMPARVPLGSLWKLWVYTYSVDQHVPDRPYACHAGTQAATGDEYCCTHDESISRNVALVRSCGAYFQPQRLQIQAKDWQRYWQQQAPDVPWLQDLSRVQPQTQVPVTDILNALNRVPPKVMSLTREALLGRVLQPQWSDVLPNLGGGYRFKTYTWAHPTLAGGYFGGAAGWLADGTAFWLGATGGSHRVVQRLSPMLAERLPPAITLLDDQCVSVHYFKRYPIAQISRVDDPKIAVLSGHLRGDYRVLFANQQSLVIRSQGELSVQKPVNQPVQLIGRLGLQDYLARVVDREGSADITQAARALSIAARSYLLQNAEFHQGCLQIDDDSRYQRVSPNPATVNAQRIVAFTEGLSLTGSSIRYHQTKAEEGLLSWQNAVKQAQQGNNYLYILKQAFPKASWQLATDGKQCQPIPEAEQYLQRNLVKVQQRMASVDGFEALKSVNVCRLDYGNPYADQQSLNIYVRDWRSQDDRVTLWHEYLHLALRFHPGGQDEAWIEQQARQLTDDLGLSSFTSTPSTLRKIRHAQ